MESLSEGPQAFSMESEETESASEFKKPMSTSTSEYLKLSSTRKVMSTTNSTEDFGPNKDHDNISIPKIDNNDLEKIEDFCQGSRSEKYQLEEKPKFTSNSDKVSLENIPNVSPTISVESIMVTAKDGFTPPPPDSDGDSGMEEPDDIKPENCFNWIESSPILTDRRHFNDNFDRNSYHVNKIPEFREETDIDIRAMFLNSFPGSGKKTCTTLTNDSVIRRAPNTLDLSTLNKEDERQDSDIDIRALFLNSFPGPLKETSTTFKNDSVIRRASNTLDLSLLSTEDERIERSAEVTDSYLPDDEFMEAERYVGKKGKQPASKKYAYKKRSKSTATQLSVDSANNNNSLTKSDIKTNDKPSTSTTLPIKAPHFPEVKSNPCTVSNKPHFTTPETTSIQGELKAGEIEWSYHDLSASSRLREINLLSDHSNNNHQYPYGKESFFDIQTSDDDVNLQRGLLMSLQSLNYNDDSDMDISTLDDK